MEQMVTKMEQGKKIVTQCLLGPFSCPTLPYAVLSSVVHHSGYILNIAIVIGSFS